MKIYLSTIATVVASFVTLTFGSVVQAQAHLQTSRIGNDFVNWSVAGPTGSTPTSPLTIASHLGDILTVRQAVSPFARLDQNNGWTGNFAPGDAVLYTQGHGPITITFATPVSEAGAQIQANSFGEFLAQIEAFGPGNTLLGTFTEAGNSTSNGDNSAIFIGVSDTTTPISSIVFSLNGTNDFAINKLDLDSAVVTTTPEPGAYALLISLGTTMGAAFLRGRRKIHTGR